MFNIYLSNILRNSYVQGKTMKTKTFLTSFTSLALTVEILIYPVISQATQISLYDQPGQNAKVIGTADLSKGIIPIYVPPNGGEWIKIADPNNGNVGWAKYSDLKSAPVLTQKIITDTQPGTNQVTPGRNPSKTSDDLSKEYVNKINADQQAVLQNFQNMLKDVNDLLHHEWKWWGEQNVFPPSNSQPNSVMPGNAQPVQAVPNQQVNPQPSVAPANSGANNPVK